MADGMTPDEMRGYREGVLEARVTGHDVHLTRLNGSMDENSLAIRDLEKSTALGFANNAKELSGISDHLIGIEMQMPKLQTAAQEQETAIRVAETLAQKKKDDETNWERWRGKIAWGGGMVGFGILVANFALRLAGI